MDTLGPVSVLDSGQRHREALVADRLTRRRCQERGRLKAAHSDLDVVYRITQPYRTSFSAKHSVERLPGSDRSRSLSPASSLRSVQSSRSERVGIRYMRHGHHRAKSPKRVTYDTRVTVRHSDADDSLFTELSSPEEGEGPRRSYGRSPTSTSTPTSSSMLTPPTPASSSSLKQTSRDSGLDYSTQLRDLSDQIIKMDWSAGQSPRLSHHHQQYQQHSPYSSQHSPHGILKESQNSHKPPHTSPASLSSSPRSLTPQVAEKDKENAPNGSPPPPPGPENWRGGDCGGGGVSRSMDCVARDYQHERVLSYTQAVNEGYGPEVRALVEGSCPPSSSTTLVGADPDATTAATTTTGNGSLLEKQRSSSVSAVSKASLSTPPSSSQLTPAKRSVSTSIGNFFRRISPRLGRRPRRQGDGHDHSNNDSCAGSSQSLPATAGVTVMDHPTSTPTSTSSTMQGGAAHTPTTTTASSSSSSRHFSRSRIRNSFLKLMGGGRKDSKSKVTAAISTPTSAPATTTTTPTTIPEARGGEVVEKVGVGEPESEAPAASGEAAPRPMPEKTQRQLRTMEQTNPCKKDVYKEFKDKRSSPRNDTTPSPSSSSADANARLEERYRAIKAQYKNRPHPLDDEFSFDVYDSSTACNNKPLPHKPHHHHHHAASSSSSPEGAGSSEGEEKVGGGVMGGGKVEPPSSLDVVPPRAIRLLQTSMMSTISGDESIGECSLDWNLTASQPSLLSGASQQSSGSGLSKKAVLNQSLLSTSTDSQQLLPSDPASNNPADPTPRPRRQKDALILGQELADNSLSLTPGDPYSSSAASPLSPLSPGGGSADPNRKPSYLKLSCAVSGYGKYSRYSSYRSIPTRSPFSSTSSLRSDLSSPDPSMPSVRTPPDHCADPTASPLTTPTTIMAAAAAAADLKNVQPRLSPSAVNGHSSAPAQKAGDYPTGNRQKDGQYFLNMMKSEEERLDQQAKRAEGLMRSQALPEEVNGRIRAAIGKSNLLISQKFKQFRELCDQHMEPDPDEQTLLFEDLQGFWALIKIQIDNVDDSFAEIVTMSQNGWKEIPKLVPSRRSSTSSSPKSGSVSQTSTPSATPGHTPGSRRRGLKVGSSKNTPDSSPEHAEKMRSAAKARDEARKRMLAEKRAAMKQQQHQLQQQTTAPEVEIFLPDGTKK